MFKGEAAVEWYVSLLESRIQIFSPACHDISEGAHTWDITLGFSVQGSFTCVGLIVLEFGTSHNKSWIPTPIS